MTPERWRRIDDLFDAATRIDPSERENWLRVACGDDGEILAELTILLEHDDRASRDGFLTLPKASPPSPTETEPRDEVESIELQDEADGFTPRAAILAQDGSHPSIGARSLARQQLHVLTLILILITLLMLVWKHAVAGDPDPTKSIPYVILLAALGAVAVRLSSQKPLSPSRLEALELGIVTTFAAAFAFTQYQAMLEFSMRGDHVRAQFVVNHRVLITAVLILSYGIYSPASWRRAALFVGSLAVLPFFTLLVLFLRNPGPMGWLTRIGSEQGTSPLALLGYDAMLLLILAVGSTIGALTISRLRVEVRKAGRLGQYRLVRRLGAGGMGQVFLAEHQTLKRPCALKLIRRGADTGPTAIGRFEREVRLTATLSHPNTVEIYDYGRTEDGTYYYVMEYLEGLNLEDLVKRHGPLPASRVVFLLRQVCLALSEAHEAGLIHRDIKPSNIFASRRGGMCDVAKLLDFGLVRPAATDLAPHLSEDGQILGTPLFMSPEQAAGGRTLDGRSDLYSLGAVAYYLLTGKPPFDRGGTIEVLIAHARDPIPPPSQVHPGVPEELDLIVAKCLAKSEVDRFPDAESLERALGRCACAEDWDQVRARRWWDEVGVDATPEQSKQPKSTGAETAIMEAGRPGP